MAIYTFVDTETRACEAAKACLAPARAPKNWKDAEKIAAYEAESLVEAEKELSLDPYGLSFRAVGWQCDDGPVSVGFGRDEDEERELLAAFWSEAEGSILVGFRVRTFDLPALVTRSRLLRVSYPYIYNEPRRWGRGMPGVIDLYDLLTFSEGFTEKNKPVSRSLVSLCQRFGCPIPTDDKKGVDMAEASWDEVADHLRRDIERTAWLAQRVGAVVLTPSLEMAL